MFGKTPGPSSVYEETGGGPPFPLVLPEGLGASADVSLALPHHPQLMQPDL